MQSDPLLPLSGFGYLASTGCFREAPESVVARVTGTIRPNPHQYRLIIELSFLPSF